VKLLGAALILCGAALQCHALLGARRQERAALRELSAALESLERGIRASLTPLPRLLGQRGAGKYADAFFADAMTIVVGIEFVKMLMLHTPRAVTDVLLFAIARQLVVNHSSAVDTLLGVAAVALIFVIKKFLHTDGDDAPAGDGRP